MDKELLNKIKNVFGFDIIRVQKIEGNEVFN